jgi:hypothetical protein
MADLVLLKFLKLLESVGSFMFVRTVWDIHEKAENVIPNGDEDLLPTLFLARRCVLLCQCSLERLILMLLAQYLKHDSSLFAD